MFSLSGATKFKYIPNYRDMRGGYDKLRGVVDNCLIWNVNSIKTR